MDKKKIIIKRIDEQIKLLKKLDPPLEETLPKWKNRAIKMLSKYSGEEWTKKFEQINTDSWFDDKNKYLFLLTELKNIFSIVPEELLKIEDISKTSLNRTSNNIKFSKKKSKKVFIIHGHDSLAKIEVARTIEKVGLEAIVLHEQPNEGKTIIEKLERDASSVSFAVAILTPDDVGYLKDKPDEVKPRARQNVILELGYFTGILGRSNVCVLHKENVEIPSDYLGVVYIKYDSSEIWKIKLLQEMKNSGLNFDLNKMI